MLFTFPSRYLFTIGRWLVFSLTQWSAQIHTGFHVSRATQELPRAIEHFGYGDLTLCVASFQMLRLCSQVPRWGPTTPGNMSPGLGFSVFARRYLRNRFLFLFLRLLRCFTSPGIAFPFLFYSERNDTVLSVPGYPIRKSPGQSLFAAHRCLSQLITSFIAFQHQGIHYVPF